MRLLNYALAFKHLYSGLNMERGFYGGTLIDLFQNLIKILQRIMQKTFTAFCLGVQSVPKPCTFHGNEDIPGPHHTWKSKRCRDGLGAVVGHPQNMKCSSPSIVCSVCAAQI